MNDVQKVATHTPAPWVAKPENNYVSAQVWTTKDCPLAEVYGEDRATRVANAKLMAAAPELLAALEAMLLMFKDGHAMSRFDWGGSFLRAEDIRELNEFPIQAQAAINKAKGAA